MIDQTFVDEVGTALLEHCPKASASPDAVARIKAKILGYDATIGPPSLNVVLAWGREEECKLQGAIDSENLAYEQERLRTAERKKEIADYVAPSSVVREEICREKAQKNATRRPAMSLPFKPAKQFTDEEIEQMDAETYKREVLGDDRNFGRQPQGESLTINFKTQRPGKRRVKTLSREELASREYRNSVIEADKEERKKLQKALKAAGRKAAGR